MRRVAIQGLPVLVGVLLIASTLTAYAWRVVFDPGQFSRRAAATLQDPDVRQAIAERATDELVQAHPDLLAARPVVVSAVSGVVGSQAFASLLRSGVRDVHAAVFRRDEGTVTLTVRDLGIVVGEALKVLKPQLAAQIEANEPVTLIHEHLDAAALVRAARDVRVLAFVLAALALACAAAQLKLSEDRRAASARLGLAVAGAGVVIALAETLGETFVSRRFADREAARGVWDAFLGDLGLAGWLLAGTGVVVAAAARSAIRPIGLEGMLLQGWRAAVREPSSVSMRALRGVALVAFGVIAIASPATVLRIAVTLVGLYALYTGLASVLRLINGPDAEALPRRARRPRRLAVPALAAAVIILGLVAFVGGGGVDAPARSLTRCNGHAALCSRTLDDVTFAATHNAMSVPLPGWYAALQGHPIPRQLQDGIRALLLDTHYADKLPNGRYRTVIDSPQDLQALIGQDGVSQQSVDAALRLRERAGFRGEGERGMYLCHTFCELGATPVADVLEDIRDFLVTHPGEVLIIVNQDYVTPADFVKAVDDAGLGSYTLTPRARGAAWPTLRQLVDRDQRLLIVAENHAGAAAWYQLAYERLMMETPFSFSEPAQLTDPAGLAATCKPNRGPAGAPLFLVNHWINTDPLPRPSHASVVNAYEPLLRRVRACERLRGHRVNLLAVDFYERGDVFKVVDALNSA